MVSEDQFCVEEDGDDAGGMPFKLTDKFLVLSPGSTKRIGDIVNDSPNSEEVTNRESK